MDPHWQYTEVDEFDGENNRDGFQYDTPQSRLLHEDIVESDDDDEDDDDDFMSEYPMGTHGDSDGEVYDDISDATDYESDEEYCEQNSELSRHIEEFNNVYREPPEVNAAGKLMCKLCPNVFVNNQTFFNHYSRTHANQVDEDDNEKECDQDQDQDAVDGDEDDGNVGDGDVDDGNPDSPVNMESRAASADRNDEGRYLCHLCSNSLATSKTLVNHWRKKHSDHFPSDDVQPTAKCRNHKCTLCKKAYRFRGGLVNHHKKDHPGQPSQPLIEMGPPSEKLPCQLCSKTLANPSTLAHHYHRYHPHHQRTDEYKDVGFEFKCEICGEPYRQKHLLDKHKEKNFCHRDWVEDPYPISEIEDTFTDSPGPTDSAMVNKTAVELFMHFFQPIMLIRQHFIRQANYVNHVFGCNSSNLRSKLVQTYSTALHGCQGWKLHNPGIERIRTSWNVMQRKVWRLPYRAHTNLLSEISGVPDIKTQIIKRSQKFIKNMTLSTNHIVKEVASAAIIEPNTVLYENNMYLTNLPQKCAVSHQVRKTSHQIKELNTCLDGEMNCGLDKDQIKEIISFLSTQ